MKPKTTPECEQLMDIVIRGLNSPAIDSKGKEAAQTALKRLHKKQCTKAIEYIIDVSGDFPPVNVFATKIHKEATNYLNDLSE